MGQVITTKLLHEPERKGSSIMVKVMYLIIYLPLNYYFLKLTYTNKESRSSKVILTSVITCTRHGLFSSTVKKALLYWY